MSSDFPGQALAAARPGAGRQCAGAVLMVRPAAFAYNPETATTNAFQRPPRPADEASSLGARAEFVGLAAALAAKGIRVCVLEDTPRPPKPDAVFPNNWISFHADGTVVLYPLQAESRRQERRAAAIEAVTERLGYRLKRVIDLTWHEAHRRHLEGTGSLVLDHLARIAYACLSPRTDEQVLAEWAGELGYRPVPFRAADRSGAPLYHTNVLMCIGERVVVVGLDAIAAADRDRVLAQLREGGREVIEIGHSQVERFAGNMLELASGGGSQGERRLLVLSEAARRALHEETFQRLAACTDEVLVAPVPTIERLGGGSVRCMLAEVFLP